MILLIMLQRPYLYNSLTCTIFGEKKSNLMTFQIIPEPIKEIFIISSNMHISKTRCKEIISTTATSFLWASKVYQSKWITLRIKEECRNIWKHWIWFCSSIIQKCFLSTKAREVVVVVEGKKCKTVIRCRAPPPKCNTASSDASRTQRPQTLGPLYASSIHNEKLHVNMELSLWTPA